MAHRAHTRGIRAYRPETRSEPRLARTGRATLPYVASQGTALGRRGRVHVTGDDAGVIWVGGGTVTLISGTVEL